jgi:hypothetical protein
VHLHKACHKQEHSKAKSIAWSKAWAVWVRKSHARFLGQYGGATLQSDPTIILDLGGVHSKVVLTGWQRDPNLYG